MLSSLRQSPKPLAAHDIAQHVMVEQWLNTADTKLVRLIGKRVRTCLRHQREKGLVRSKPAPGAYLVWEIAD